MTNKTRKHIWPGALVMAIAIVGLLAAFAVLATNPGGAMAQSGDTDPCAGLSGRELSVCRALNPGTQPTQPPATQPPATQPPGGAPGTGGSGTGNPLDMPGRPMNLEAEHDGPTIIKLTWDAPEDGGSVTAYRIDQSDDGTKWEEFVVNTGNATTQYLHRNLTSQTMHYYRVYALNSVDTGPVSNIEMGTSDKSDRPEAPANLEAIAPDSNGGSWDERDFDIALYWDAPEDPIGAPVVDYMIEVSDDGTVWRQLVIDEDLTPVAGGPYAGKQNWTHEVLYGRETRYYRVSARNDLGKSEIGVSELSNTALATTQDGPVPNNIEGGQHLRVAVQPTSVDVWLYWDSDRSDVIPVGTNPLDMRVVIKAAPAANLGSAALGRHSGDPGLDDFALDSALLEDVSWTTDYEAPERVTGFDMGTIHAFMVLPKNKFGTSDPATAPVVRGIVGSDNAPNPPRITSLRKSADPADLHDGRTRLELTWNAATNNTDAPGVARNDRDYAEAYRIEVSMDGQEWEEVIATGAELDVPAHYNADGRATYVRTIGFTGSAAADLQQSIKVTDQELAAGEELYFRVFAMTRANPATAGSGGFTGGAYILGVPSDEETGTTAAPLLPGITRNLVVRSTGRTTLGMTWDAPEITGAGCDQTPGNADDTREDDGSECGDSVITHYQIQVSDDGKTGSWTNLDTAVCCEFEHTDLQPGTTKHYRVYAVNATGKGGLSNTDLNTTKKAEFPDVVGGFTGEKVDEDGTSVKLCWVAQSIDPTDDPVHSYQIMVSGRTDPVMVMANADGVVPTQTTITGLTPDTEYTFSIRAVNNRGASNEDSVETVRTAETVVPSNTPPTAVGEIEKVTVKVDETKTITNAASTYFEDVDADDKLSYDASSSDEMIATAMITADDDMISVKGVAAGTATITVTATDMAGATVTQTFTVIVTEVLTMPTNIQANPQGSGLVSVSWKTAAGASGYTIIAINVEDVNDYETKILDDETETSTQIALTAGKIYNVYVGSFSGQEFKLNTDEKKRVEVE